MKCKNCGRDIDESMKFCPECGEILDPEIYNKKKIENDSDMPKEENVNNSDSSEEKIESTLESQEETVDKDIQKVRDEVARGAVKYVTTAEMGALSGNLYLTNYKNLYFISNGKRETYLLESKTESITRTGRRIIVEMKDGEEYTFDTQRSFDARSLVKKTKWSLQDDGVVYDDEVYASEDDSEYYEEDSKSHGKKAAIFIVLVIVGALCFQFGPKLFKKISSSGKDETQTFYVDSRCDECGVYDSEIGGNNRIKRYYIYNKLSIGKKNGKYVNLCPECKEKYEENGVDFD